MWTKTTWPVDDHPAGHLWPVGGLWITNPGGNDVLTRSDDVRGYPSLTDDDDDLHRGLLSLRTCIRIIIKPVLLQYSMVVVVKPPTVFTKMFR